MNIKNLTAIQLASYIDHTLLKPLATQEDIKKLCFQAKTYQFKTVCVAPCFVSLAYSLLKETNVGVCSVIGFPLGNHTSFIKVEEAQKAIDDGAHELDMVINLGFLKDGQYEKVTEEIHNIVSLGTDVKVIVETSFLTKDEKLAVLDCVIKAKAQFIKTSTGFGGSVATKEDVELLYTQAKNRVLVKASGGIKTLEDAFVMLKAGAKRIGTSSGVALIEQFKGLKNE